MNREIKFRIKHNGEWYYGTPLTVIKTTDKLCAFQGINSNGKDLCSMSLKTDTLGQFTGLCDKNGKEIYEGDIIKHFICKTIDGKSKYITFCINWGDDNRYRAYKNGLKGYSYEISFANYVYNPKDNEVIGNIYDNPELLKGE